MNPVTSLVLSFALVLGGAGAVFAFDRGAHPGETHAVVAPPLAASGATANAARPAGHHHARHHTVTRWAPCRTGSRLEDGVCVTDVVRTVTLPAPAVAAPAVHSSGTAPAAHRGHDNGEEHAGRGEGHDGGGDG
jgi:hypothetical protein